jgi:hypothetical protein
MERRSRRKKWGVKQVSSLASNTSMLYPMVSLLRILTLISLNSINHNCVVVELAFERSLVDPAIVGVRGSQSSSSSRASNSVGQFRDQVKARDNGYDLMSDKLEGTEHCHLIPQRHGDEVWSVPPFIVQTILMDLSLATSKNC